MKRSVLIAFFIVVIFTIRANNVECGERIEPTKATYIITVDPNENKALIEFDVTLNNSYSVPVNGSFNIDHREQFILVKEKFVLEPIIRKEALNWLQNNITVDVNNGTTRLYGTIWNISLRPYECAYLSLRYLIRDVTTTQLGMRILDYGVEVKAKEVTFIIRLPKHSFYNISGNKILDSLISIFRINYLSLHLVEPYPSEISEVGDYVSLIWREPIIVKENGVNKFNPVVIFQYELNKDLLYNLTATFFVALLTEQIFVRVLYPIIKIGILKIRNRIRRHK